jgi:hypothetical protein
MAEIIIFATMVKINVHEDCGNAPKKLFLKDFIVAIVKKDNAFLTRNTTDDVHWNLVGGQPIGGKQEVLTAFQQTRSDEVRELVVNTIVTHGYNGVVEGLLKFKDGRTIAFCDVYLFRASTNNAPIKAITTYAITLV